MSKKIELTKICGKFTKKNRDEKRKFLSMKDMAELKKSEAEANAKCKRENTSKNKIRIFHCSCSPDCKGFIVEQENPNFPLISNYDR